MNKKSKLKITQIIQALNNQSTEEDQVEIIETTDDDELKKYLSGE